MVCYDARIIIIINARECVIKPAKEQIGFNFITPLLRLFSRTRYNESFNYIFAQAGASEVAECSNSACLYSI